MPFIETADRTSLFVTDWGSGPPVVFTHDPRAGHGLYASDHDALNADLLTFINGHRPQAGQPHHTRSGPMASVKQFQVTFDCPEPERLARFWCEVLG